MWNGTAFIVLGAQPNGNAFALDNSTIMSSEDGITFQERSRTIFPEQGTAGCYANSTLVMSGIYSAALATQPHGMIYSPTGSTYTSLNTGTVFTANPGRCFGRYSVNATASAGFVNITADFIVGGVDSAQATTGSNMAYSINGGRSFIGTGQGYFVGGGGAYTIAYSATLGQWSQWGLVQIVFFIQHLE